MFILIVAALLGVLYFYLKYHYNHWQRLKVPGPEGEFIFGNLRDVITMKKNIGQQLDVLYNEYKDYDFIGFYKFLKPCILLRSPELINKVLVQDFDSFQSNDFEIGDHDAITSKNPFLVSGSVWRKTRNSITPVFTSGKLKYMVPLTFKASENMISFLKTNESLNTTGGFDARDIALRFTTDNTASVAFGLEANSFDFNDNSFLQMSQRAFGLGFVNALKLMIVFNLPTIGRILRLKFIEPTVQDFFHQAMLKSIKYRQDTSTIRNDILHQFLELRKKLGDDEFGEIDVLAQSIFIILNGAEASSATMGFMLYLLASHLDVQKKARGEICAVLKKHNNELSYDALKDMVYLNQVINETLRLYPATSVNQKRCTKRYTIPETKNTPELTLESGTPVMIAVRALNVDEKYFPDPEKFNPERFNPENSENIPKNVFLPFGDGPRICLGQRFALIQMKLGMARLLNEFDITLNKKTILPVEISPRSFLSRSKNPIYVNFHKRTEIIG